MLIVLVSVINNILENVYLYSLLKHAHEVFILFTQHLNKETQRLHANLAQRVTIVYRYNMIFLFVRK